MRIVFLSKFVLILKNIFEKKIVGAKVVQPIAPGQLWFSKGHHSLPAKLKDIMMQQVASFLKEEVDEQLAVRTTNEYLQKINFIGTDTNKDSLWNQVAVHVIQEIFDHLQARFKTRSNWKKTEPGLAFSYPFSFSRCEKFPLRRNPKIKQKSKN